MVAQVRGVRGWGRGGGEVRGDEGGPFGDGGVVTDGGEGAEGREALDVERVERALEAGECAQDGGLQEDGEEGRCYCLLGVRDVVYKTDGG